MISLDEAKRQVRLELDFVDEDILLQSLIDAAVRNLEHETGRTLRVREETLVLDKWLDRIRLPWWPIKSIDSVAYTDPEGGDQLAQNFRVDLRRFPAAVLKPIDQHWPEIQEGGQSIEITATVGMDELPSDLKLAGLLLVGHFYENREAVAVGTIATALPLSVEYLVQPYRLTRVA